MRHASRLLLVALLTSACATTGASSSGASKPSTAAATDFTLTGLDGGRVTLSEHLGKQVILLNFWATWCPPCMTELPHLQALYEKHRESGLLVLGISMDGPESLANVAPLVRRKGLTYPVLLDEETRVVGLYNPRRAAPFNVLIDRTGRVVRASEGFSSGDEGSLEAAVLALLGAPGEAASASIPAP